LTKTLFASGDACYQKNDFATNYKVSTKRKKIFLMLS